MTEMTEKKVRVIRTDQYGQESDIEERLGLVNLEGTPASIAVNLSRTVNLGNYESAKIGVIVTLPCAPSRVSDAYEEALSFASSKLVEELDKIGGR